LAGAQKDALGAVLNDIQQKVSATFAEAQNSMREQVAQEVGSAQQLAAAALQEHTQQLREALKQESTAHGASVLGSLGEQTRQLEETLARANQATERLEQFAARIEGVQQLAISGFQAQLDDVLSIHRNELHRQSDASFEEIHARIRSSFDAANTEALEKFEQHVESMVQPHITRTEEAVHRLAGGRSLLDAAMTMQQDRIRNSADEAFAESLARFRENLGTVEQVLSESAQGITTKHLEELEGKAVDLKHTSMEEMFKSAEWYEKKAQTQLQSSTEKLVEQAGMQLREKAGEVSSLFASELNHASRSYVEQSHRQMEESVRESFERIRILSAEAADTTSAAFTDEIQRNGRHELEGFMELMQKTVEESRERLDAARAEMTHKLTGEQDEFLRRFQAGMNETTDQRLMEAKDKVRTEFDSLWESWRKMTAEQQTEIRNGLHKMGDEAVVEFRGRLENISNSWMVATVTTLNHQSKDVIAQIAATAEERLREASAEVFAKFGDTLRERLQQIAAGFEKGQSAKAGG
jgi:hypothetical protein